MTRRFNYPLEKLRQEPDFARLPESDQKALLAESLIRQVMGVAEEALQRHGQKPKAKISAADRDWETGVEMMTNQLGEDHVDFSVAFEGDHDGAVAAADEWVERVKTFGGIREVGRAALRGTDGTNAQLFSEEIMEQVENLDEETRARIDELMDPDR